MGVGEGKCLCFAWSELVPDNLLSMRNWVGNRSNGNRIAEDVECLLKIRVIVYAVAEFLPNDRNSTDTKVATN